MAFRNEMHVQEYIYDFAVDGGATGAIDLSAKGNYDVLPQGAIIENVSMKIVTACTSGGSATVSLGNTTDADGYQSLHAVATLTDDAVYRVGEVAGALMWDDTNDHMLSFPVNSANDAVFSLTIATAALTAGKIVCWVNYYMPSED